MVAVKERSKRLQSHPMTALIKRKTKRNETKRNETKRNETKRNETKENERRLGKYRNNVDEKGHQNRCTGNRYGEWQSEAGPK